MKTKYVFGMIILLLSFGFVTAESYTENFTIHTDIDSTSLQVESLKYDPYPVNPGEYFTLWISVYKTGSGVSGATFELDPQYPFSLDSNEDSTREYSALSGKYLLLEYKIRVDDDAVEDKNQISLNYRLDGSSNWITKDFDIYVSDAQTTFDGVIQEIEGSTIALALANTGKNVANSVIVKLPQQDNFKAVGTSGQMVGNLENGDYTIVSFDIRQISKIEDSKIIFQIDYTDNIDERRTEYLELSLDMNSGLSMSSEELPEKFQRQNGMKASQQKSNVWIWILVIAVVLVLFGYRKKIINLLRKRK